MATHILRLLLACGHYQLSQTTEGSILIGDMSPVVCVHCRPSQQVQVVDVDPVPSIRTRAGWEDARAERDEWLARMQHLATQPPPDPDHLRAQFEELGYTPITREEDHG